MIANPTRRHGQLRESGRSSARGVRLRRDHHPPLRNRERSAARPYLACRRGRCAVKRDPNGDIVVRVEWLKDGAADEVIVSKLEVVEVGLDEDGEPMTSCVVVPSDAARPARRTTVALSARLRCARELLESMMERDGHAIDEPGHAGLVPKRVKTVKVDQWRKECYLSLPVDSEGEAEKDTKRKAFLRVRRDLAAKGVMKESDGWVWLVARAPCQVTRARTATAGHRAALL